MRFVLDILGQDIEAIDFRRKPRGDSGAALVAALADIEGVVVLDGTWSQAKTLWWRNPWMLKCRRVVLGPRQPSRYGKLRREPRREGLATIEAAAMLLGRLDRPEIEQALSASFERMLARYRASRVGKGA